MKSFSDFNIKLKGLSFKGDKVKVREILNLPIVILDFKIKESRFKRSDNEKFLQLQIQIGSEKRVVFTGSKVLLNQIKHVPEDGFPFETKIVQEGEMFMFV